jgi:hypothetical protein
LSSATVRSPNRQVKSGPISQKLTHSQHSLDHFNQATDDAPSFQTRIGLATGEVLVGNIGTARHLSPSKREQMVGQVRCWASLRSLVLAFLIF